MATDERSTGTPNHVYDAVSALTNILEAGAAYDQYIDDAQQADDQELADYFRGAQEEDRRRAEELKRLLNTRLAAQPREGSRELPGAVG